MFSLSLGLRLLLFSVSFYTFMYLCCHFHNYQHLNLGCPATHNSVSRSEFFKGVVIYSIFTYVDIVFFTVSKIVQHIT